MRQAEPTWWAEARKLAAPPYGLSYAAIGRILKRTGQAVKYALDEKKREHCKAYAKDYHYKYVKPYKKAPK